MCRGRSAVAARHALTSAGRFLCVIFAIANLQLVFLKSVSGEWHSVKQKSWLFVTRACKKNEAECILFVLCNALPASQKGIAPASDTLTKHSGEGERKGHWCLHSVVSDCQTGSMSIVIGALIMYAM